jgi:acetolactate decarboxylase
MLAVRVMINIKLPFSLIVGLLLLTSCKQQTQETTGSPEKSAVAAAHSSNSIVESYGSRHAIMMDNDLTGIVRLDTLLKQPNSFAIGPVEDLQGEITIYNDKVSISSIVAGLPQVSESLDTKAIFLLKAHHKSWNYHKIDKELRGLDAVENYIGELISSNGYDPGQAIPFRIEATVPSMTYHIIFKTGNAPHNMLQHKKAKRIFSLENESVNMIGFWMDPDRVGKLTHHGQRTHLHFQNVENSTSGHVDDVVIPRDAVILLPRLQ